MFADFGTLKEEWWKFDEFQLKTNYADRNVKFGKIKL